MVVGPGEAEMAIHNVEAIAVLYPEAEVWLRDDATTDGTWERLSSELSNCVQVHLTRNSQPLGYYRLPQTCCQLLSEIAKSKPDLVIKIDPDTVLMRSGLVDLFRNRFAAYGNGICGSYRVSPSGTPRDFKRHAIMMFFDLLPIGPQKKAPFRWRPVGHFRYLVRALPKGYQLGENVQGGLYAVDGGTLQCLSDSGFFSAIVTGQRGRVWAEDVLLTLGVKAVGGKISPLNEHVHEAPTHIQAFCPLTISEERLSDPALLAVHPVKASQAALRMKLSPRGAQLIH